MQTLRDIEYEGPICLQTYGIDQPPEEHLPRSMNTWRTLRKQLVSNPPK